MFTSEIVIEEGNPVALVKHDGVDLIRQPHHPEAHNFKPWQNEEDAKAWAEAWIATEGPLWVAVANNPLPKPEEE